MDCILVDNQGWIGCLDCKLKIVLLVALEIHIAIKEWTIGCYGKNPQRWYSIKCLFNRFNNMKKINSAWRIDTFDICSWDLFIFDRLLIEKLQFNHFMWWPKSASQSFHVLVVWFFFAVQQTSWCDKPIKIFQLNQKGVSVLVQWGIWQILHLRLEWYLSELPKQRQFQPEMLQRHILIRKYKMKGKSYYFFDDSNANWDFKHS